MTAVKLDHDTLVHAFREAAKAALAADPALAPDAGDSLDYDGGTCNFDTPAVCLPGLRESFVDECAAEAGVSASSFKWLGGRRWFFVFVPLKGQANRRSLMAEAACRRLKELGLDAVLYCQAD